MLPCASRCTMLRMDSIVASSKAVAAVLVSVTALRRHSSVQCERHAEYIHGWASFIAFVGSAFEVILPRAFSLAVSVKSIFGAPS